MQVIRLSHGLQVRLTSHPPYLIIQPKKLQRIITVKGPSLRFSLHTIHSAGQPAPLSARPASPATGNGQTPAHTPALVPRRSASRHKHASAVCLPACLPSFDVCTRQLSSGHLAAGPERSVMASSTLTLGQTTAAPGRVHFAPPGSVQLLRGQGWSSQSKRSEQSASRGFRTRLVGWLAA